MRILNYIKENYILISILVLASLLRIYHLDFQSIWLDEIHTMIEANPSLTFKEFDNVIMAREGIPHFYFLIVRFFFDIFGYSTFVARLVSALVGIVSVFAIYLLGKELFNKRAGLIAASLLAVNHFHIYYSQEARSYAMLLLFTILAFYRLSIFIKNPKLYNAILFGIFSGLITHAHPIGLTVIFAQFLILLLVLIKSVPNERKQFFKLSFISGMTALIVFYPVYRIVTKVSDIKSFWVSAPGPDVYTQIINDFLGRSELTFFIFNILFVFYAYTIFMQKLVDNSLDSIKKNNLVLGFIFFTAWTSIAFIIPLLKSYLQVPMIVNRYFINILPVVILIIAISIELINTKIVKLIIIISLLLFSLIDLFVVKNYYNTVTKTQFREVTEVVLKRNKEKDKVVSAYGWLLSYYLNADKTNKQTTESTLENYISSMNNNTIPKESFWYVDGSFRPYNLGPEQEQFLQENFVLEKSVSKHDAWARFYRSKIKVVNSSTNSTKKSGDGKLSITDFTPLNLDGNGNMMFFENSMVRSSMISLNKGKYNLVIKGNSLPEKPIKGENAHFKIRLNGSEIGNLYLSEKVGAPETIIPFECDRDQEIRIQLIFDNDLSIGSLDRNAVIYNIKIEKR